MYKSIGILPYISNTSTICFNIINCVHPSIRKFKLCGCTAFFSYFIGNITERVTTYNVIIIAH